MRRRKASIDFQDQVLFFSLFAIGAAAIWALKLLKLHQFLVTAVPVGLMALYALIALATKRYRIREDKVGDNIYYLGFLYTLVSLSYALWIYDPDGSGATEIITNFGIAIFTTIIGLAGRVFFNQMREDPEEYEREARQSLAQATNQLRAQLADIAIEVSNFKRKILQIMEEGVIDISNSTRATLGQNLEQISSTNKEVVENIRSAFSTFTNHASKLNDVASKNVEALHALFQRIEAIEASPELLARKLDPLLQKFGEVADEAQRRNRAQTNDLKRLRDVIDVAVSATDTLRNTIVAADDSINAKVDRFGTGLEKTLVAAERFSESLEASTKRVSSEIAAIGAASSGLLGSFESQKHAAGEIRLSIEADLKAIAEHRDMIAALAAESRQSLTELQSALVSLSRTMAEELSGR
jgi:DNA repair exonuclease SbcCD ATPase subunit